MTSYTRKPIMALATCSKRDCWQRIFWQTDYPVPVEGIAQKGLERHHASKHPSKTGVVGTIKRSDWREVITISR